MKFLHLSDLHIGKSVNGFLMLAEQRNAFAQIIEYIETKKPEAVLITGDIYDRVVPSVEAVHLFDDFLTKLDGFDMSQARILAHRAIQRNWMTATKEAVVLA